MKYIFILLLISLSFFLSSCFEKRSDTSLQNTGEILDELQNNRASGSENKVSDQVSSLGEENNTGTSLVSGEKKDITGETPSASETSQNVSQEEVVQEQQEIIQNTEEDLEALFDDLIKGE